MKKKLMSLLLVGVCTLGLMACGTSESESTNQAADSSDAGQTADAKTDTSELSGTITLAGSTSMEKLCEAMSESFMETYPNVTVTVEYTGSGAGLESLAAGSIDIGNASRHLKDEEVETGAVENVVAIDGIAVITDKDNTVTGLTAK